MTQNVTANIPGSNTRPGSSKPTGNKYKEIGIEEEKNRYGPWTIAPSRRKSQQGKHKPKAQHYKSNRFEALKSTKEHGENSRA